MAKPIDVIFIQADGTEQTVKAETGQTLMEAALLNDIPGIIGLCGGILSCGTCLCDVEASDYARLSPPGEEEKEMLESLDNVSKTTRLGCQCLLKDENDGIRVRVPQ